MTNPFKYYALMYRKMKPSIKDLAWFFLFIAWIIGMLKVAG